MSIVRQPFRGYLVENQILIHKQWLSLESVLKREDQWFKGYVFKKEI